MISIIGGIALLIGGFLSASAFILQKLPSLREAKVFLSKYEVVVGLVLLGVAAFWTLFLVFGTKFSLMGFIALIAAVANGLLLSMSFLKTKNLPQDKLEMIETNLARFQIPLGLVSLVMGVWIFIFGV